MMMMMMMVIMMIVVVLSKDTSIYDKIEASFIAGLIGDSLALAGHYEYDAVKIKTHVGEYRNLMAPGEGMGGKTHGVGWGSANYHVILSSLSSSSSSSSSSSPSSSLSLSSCSSYRRHHHHLQHNTTIIIIIIVISQEK